MIGIVIVAHDRLATSLLQTVDHVFGPQPGMQAVMVDSDHNRDMVRDMISKAASAVDTGDGVVIVTDVYGGSPCNLSLKTKNISELRVIYGANVPLLLTLTKSRHLPLSEAVHVAVEAGRKYIGSISVPPNDD